MATVNWSGTYTTNQTMLAADTNIMTNTIDISTGCVFTIQAGATLTCATTQTYYRFTVTTGSLIAIGTPENPITFNTAATDANASSASWGGVWLPSNASGTATLQYCKIRNANSGINVFSVAATASVTNCWIDGCVYAIYMGNPFTAYPSLTLQNILITNCPNSISTALDGNSWTPTFSNFYITSLGSAYGNSIIKTNGLICSKWVVKDANFCFPTSSTLACNVNFVDSYFGTTASGQNGIIYSTVAGDSCSITKSVVQNRWPAGVFSGFGAGKTATSSYNDFISVTSTVFVSSTSGTSDNDYVAGCALRDSTIVETGATVTQIGSIATITNRRATPNKPLIADNNSVTAFTSNSATITFDSAQGSTNNRLDAIGFVEYGTVSGTYTMSSIRDFPDALELGKCWTGLSTKYTYHTTGHSVTLVNLRYGTTYYYRCGIIDPLGRVGYSSEGTFTTLGSGAPLPWNI